MPAEGEEEEDYNSEDEDDDEDFDSEEDMDEEEEEICPPGCDPALYEKVCELREKRLDQEEVYSEFQKSIEVLKKENDTHIKKEKTIDKALKDTESDIQAFQTEKQRKLNELDVVVTLKMSQVQCLQENKLPNDVSDCLVFTNAELKQLKDRIKELQQEKQALRNKHRDLKKEYVVLNKDKSFKLEKISELSARQYDVQMLKFGQMINLEALENMSVNKTAEELKEKVRQLEKRQEKELAIWDKKLQAQKMHFRNSTLESTQHLNKVADLFHSQHKLETALNTNQDTLVANAPTGNDAERAERSRLVQLVKIQAKEIEALKVEINMLRRKGGHVYSPPVPQQQQGAENMELQQQTA